jgi:hypothetical protein
MSTPLGGFLTELATDPKKYQEFIEDPDGALEAAALSTADQVVIKSGNPGAIQTQLAGSTPGDIPVTDSNCPTVYWAVLMPNESDPIGWGAR